MNNNKKVSLHATINTKHMDVLNAYSGEVNSAYSNRSDAVRGALDAFAILQPLADAAGIPLVVYVDRLLLRRNDYRVHNFSGPMKIDVETAKDTGIIPLKD